jgi:hypothetical protein
LVLFVNKVYSPQYSLWIVTLLAAIGVSTALAVTWSAADLLYFGAWFAVLGLSQFSDVQGWFEGYVLMPSVGLREAMLLIVAGWCVKQMFAAVRDFGDPSERPRGGSVNVA